MYVCVCVRLCVCSCASARGLRLIATAGDTRLFIGDLANDCMDDVLAAPFRKCACCCVRVFIACLLRVYCVFIACLLRVRVWARALACTCAPFVV